MFVTLVALSTVYFLATLLALYFAVRTLSERVDSNNRWHRQALNTEIDTLLREHEGRLADHIRAYTR